jgi:hypothetical protein
MPRAQVCLRMLPIAKKDWSHPSRLSQNGWALTMMRTRFRYNLTWPCIHWFGDGMFRRCGIMVIWDKDTTISKTITWTRCLLGDKGSHDSKLALCWLSRGYYLEEVHISYLLRYNETGIPSLHAGNLGFVCRFGKLKDGEPPPPHLEQYWRDRRRIWTWSCQLCSDFSTGQISGTQAGAWTRNHFPKFCELVTHITPTMIRLFDAVSTTIEGSDICNTRPPDHGLEWALWQHSRATCSTCE